MNILQILEPMGIGGVERIVSMLHSHMLKYGENAYIAMSSNAYDVFISHFGINDASRICKFRNNNVITSLYDIRRIINIINPDVIQTHARKECFYTALLNQKRVHIRTQHMSESPKKFVTRFEKRLFNKYVTGWVATSKSLVDDYLGKLDYIKRKNIYIIYNGVMEPKFTKNMCKLKNKYCIVSRLSAQKGIDILIDSVANMPHQIIGNLRIDIYGEGEEKDTILKQIRDNNLSEVFHYNGSTNQPSDVIVNYDALLMPSRHEGLPLTMLESMATGTPVAIHDVGCIGEIINPGVNGWIINDQYSWLDFFKNISYCNYASISLNARDTFLKKFTESHMCEEYRALYMKMLGDSDSCAMY